MPLTIRPIPKDDSDHYISAGAYELIEHLYWKWRLYLEVEKETVSDGTRGVPHASDSI